MFDSSIGFREASVVSEATIMSDGCTTVGASRARPGALREGAG